MANADLSIRDGQTAEMMIATEGTPAHLLPASALTLDDDGRLGLRIVDADSRAAIRAGDGAARYARRRVADGPAR